MWGQMHEAQAIQEYMEKTGNMVKPAGLHLFPCGFLGSSPDGIIECASPQCDPGVLEIKCPRKYRNRPPTFFIESKFHYSYLSLSQNQ